MSMEVSREVSIINVEEDEEMGEQEREEWEKEREDVNGKEK